METRKAIQMYGDGGSEALKCEDVALPLTAAGATFQGALGACKNGLLGLLLVASLGSEAGCTRTSASEGGAASAPPIAVRTTLVGEVDAPLTLRVSGSLRGLREADVAANATGRVTATSVERGMRVKAGQVLAQLDVRAVAISAAEARAQAESARAQAAQQKSECERYEQLKTTGTITDLAYDRMASGCRTSALGAEASYARARMAAQSVGDGSIRAPFAGVVTERFVEVGEFVKQDSRVVTLVSMDVLRLEFAVPEADAAKVREDATISFHVAAFPERAYSGKVRFVSGGLRATTRDLVVEALVDNSDGSLRPGMFADIELDVGTRRLASVPKEALIARAARPRAFFVVDGRLEERVLSTLPATEAGVPVLKGAKPGEQVAIGDLTVLANGRRVR
jgi:RND family efflux transporter MFP subunit